MKGSERKARKLHAKPEALRARGKPVPDDHGVGDVARENAERVAQLAAAHALIDHGTQMISAAYTMVRGVVGDTHHAAVYAAQAVDVGSKARESAKQALRALGRTL